MHERNVHERSERDASAKRARSAKPKGAKRPSSPAGLAGRSAERACKLVEDEEKQLVDLIPT